MSSEQLTQGDGRKSEITVGQLLLTEYQTIKDEQKARIGFRDNLLYVTLAAVAAVIVAAAQAKQPGMLLALPPVCVVLGWTYLVNDEKISAIGDYVRTELGPRLAAAAGSSGTAEVVFKWETAHRSAARRRSRKLIQCAVDQGGVLRRTAGNTRRVLGAWRRRSTADGSVRDRGAGDRRAHRPDPPVRNDARYRRTITTSGVGHAF
ncbi:hypothetical protein [Actinomadura sp. DC4]|uniref:hypothetical protein n=1 Tax=Actinomadura sp. DC4 TaxID=3055069 RepID=UPI0025B13918|nr:hypothetical protein [Actinomadura sp. DC4]MDN3358106.1 hypothetical protein [Actinomadura sp. DC4]